VTADRTGLSDGSYTAVVTVAYTVDAAPRTLGIPVTLSVNTGGGAGTGADTGFTWILAIDATTLQTVAVDTAANVDGEYSYTLTGIPNGEYYIVAGTDSDNDNILCDAGEACGAYPTLGLLERVIVQDGNISGLDFGLTFPIEIGSTALSKALDADRPGFSKSVSIKRTEGTLP
jgi:serine protease